MKHLFYLNFFLFFLFSLNLSAGVKMVMKSESKGCNEFAGSGQTTFYLRPDIMRADMEEGGQRLTFIYKKSEQKFWILDHQKKSYESITKEDLEKLNSVFEEMRKNMEEQLEKIPEDQRQQVREMMMAQEATLYKRADEVAYVKRDETQQIQNWDCVRYDYLENEKLESILWVAPYEETHTSKEDFQILHDLAEFLRSNLNMMSLGATESMITPGASFEGFPLKTVMLEGNKECLISTVQTIQQETLENSLFQIPKDYRREENPLKGR